jgi:hypothetical protein
MESQNVNYSQGEKLWSFVISIVVVPTIDPIVLDVHEAKEAKDQRLILDGVKDSHIPHLVENKTTYEMWETQENLYEEKNENQKMV